jgi:hypothetical protein
MVLLLMMLLLLQDVDVFEKDYIFVPIHDALHWSLVVICHPGKWHKQAGEGDTCLLHFDSLKGVCNAAVNERCRLQGMCAGACVETAGTCSHL